MHPDINMHKRTDFPGDFPKETAWHFHQQFALPAQNAVCSKAAAQGSASTAVVQVRQGRALAVFASIHVGLFFPLLSGV